MFAHPYFDSFERKLHDMCMRISVDANVHFGKPCVTGTRIPVEAVLELLREGLSFAQVADDYYPELTPDDIKACLQHAIDVLNAEELHVAVA